MSANQGTATFVPGTGNKSINVGMTNIKWLTIDFGGGNIFHSKGSVYGGTQTVYSDEAASCDNTKCIKVKDRTTGTIIVEGTYTNNTTTYLNFNLTTNPSSSVPQMNLAFGDTI